MRLHAAPRIRRRAAPKVPLQLAAVNDHILPGDFMNANPPLGPPLNLLHPALAPPGLRAVALDAVAPPMPPAPQFEHFFPAPYGHVPAPPIPDPRPAHGAGPLYAGQYGNVPPAPRVPRAPQVPANYNNTAPARPVFNGDFRLQHAPRGLADMAPTDWETRPAPVPDMAQNPPAAIGRDNAHNPGAIAAADCEAFMAANAEWNSEENADDEDDVL